MEHPDFYTAAATIIPILWLALVLELGLSAAGGFYDLAKTDAGKHTLVDGLITLATGTFLCFGGEAMALYALWDVGHPDGFDDGLSVALNLAGLGVLLVAELVNRALLATTLDPRPWWVSRFRVTVVGGFGALALAVYLGTFLHQ